MLKHWSLLMALMGAACYLLLLLLTAGCTGPARTITSTEADQIAWWCEDYCHGIDRTVGELRTVDASAGMLRVAEWAASAESTGGAHHHLAARRQRWPVIRGFLRANALQSTPEGLFILTSQASGDTARLAQRVADAENQDRRTVVVLVLTMTQPPPPMEAAMRKAFITAAITSDAAAVSPASASSVKTVP